MKVFVTGKMKKILADEKAKTQLIEAIINNRQQNRPSIKVETGEPVTYNLVRKPAV